MSYADPDHTLPEVHRLLRPGGRLVFNTFSPFASVCWNEETGRTDEALHRPYFAPARWADDNGFVSFELGYGDWIRALRRHGFVVDDLRELRPGAAATSSHHGPRERAWARRWPAEQVWSAHAAPRP
jgi:SAM-dependent methyltransferase